MDGASKKGCPDFVRQGSPGSYRPKNGEALQAPKEKIMWIRLTRDWHNYRKGSVLQLPDTEGLELIIAHKAIKAHEGDYMRNISSPPMDRMVREPRLQK